MRLQNWPEKQGDDHQNYELRKSESSYPQLCLAPVSLDALLFNEFDLDEKNTTYISSPPP